MELWELTTAQMKKQLESKSVSAAEIVRSIYDRIEQVEDRLQAFITLMDKEPALQAAEEFTAGSFTGIQGIPYALKDNICTRGLKTTCASKMLEEFIPVYDATVVKKLQEQKGLLLGKLNLDEFAMGTSTEHSFFKITKNPWDISRVPGGSSGGCAAAVAAGEIPFALGTDTGGSLRQPAAYCGVVGMKPTYGRISRWGVTALASSLDQVGCITKDVRDCALVLNLIAGFDPLDSTCVNAPCPDYESFLKPDVKGLRIGVPREYFHQGLEPDIKALIEKALTQYESWGANVEEISLPHTEYALPACYVIIAAEASTNLALYDGVRFGFRAREEENVFDMYSVTRGQGFGDEVKRRIIFGTFALSSNYYHDYYLKALKMRNLVRQDFTKAFEQVDVIIAPTAPTTAFMIGEKVQDALTLYLNDRATAPVNMAGLPGISVPCGFSQGLPAGMQIIGRPWEEGTILQMAYAFEQNNDYHTKRPQMEVK